MNMFSYHGSKSKIAYLYPKPKHDILIEPFCGSARYALLHWEKDVILSDTSPYVKAVWQYLLQANKRDILDLPYVPSGVNIHDYPDTRGLSDAQKYLIGFCICRGKSVPRQTGHAQNSWTSDKRRIANNVHKIKHWQWVDGGYEKLNLLDLRATWFIDPPYQQVQKETTMRYFHWKVDYNNLSECVKSRRGQTIVCEGAGANWLPFEFLTLINGTSNKPQFEYVYEQNRD